MSVVPDGHMHGALQAYGSRIIAVAFIAAIAALIILPQSLPTTSRDETLTAAPTAIAATNALALEDYLKRRAVLLLIRSQFDVVPRGQIEDVLAADAQRLGGAPPSPGDADALDRDLLAEGSYYLVSLRYLIQSGGAAWPHDRAGAAYDEAALIRLDFLLERLFVAVQARTDPLPVFLEAQDIQALAEGFKTPPDSWGRFSDRDRLVTQVIANHGPVART